MVHSANPLATSDPVELLVKHSFLFRGLDSTWLRDYFNHSQIISEKLYSNRPIYTAFRPDNQLAYLYVAVGGGPVIIRSTPLDRVLAIIYPQGCFGMRSLPVAFGQACRAFPSLVEAYKTTDVIKLPAAAIGALYANSPEFQRRYNFLFELQEKFQYHLLNCSTYPPQAVAALLRGLVYQERGLGAQPQSDGTYQFDLSVDLIARACQLNHRTVEQVLKGMMRSGLIKVDKGADAGDSLQVINPEALKEVYGATRDRVAWWPLK